MCDSATILAGWSPVRKHFQSLCVEGLKGCQGCQSVSSRSLGWDMRRREPRQDSSKGETLAREGKREDLMGKDTNVCVWKRWVFGRGQSEVTANALKVPPHCVSLAAPRETRARLPVTGAVAGTGKGHASRKGDRNESQLLDTVCIP